VRQTGGYRRSLPPKRSANGKQGTIWATVERQGVRAGGRPGRIVRRALAFPASPGVVPDMEAAPGTRANEGIYFFRRPSPPHAPPPPPALGAESV